MQRLGFSQVHSECDVSCHTVITVTYTQVSASLLYSAPICGNGSSTQIWAERTGRGAAPCRAPRLSQTLRADKDIRRLEGLGHLQNKKPLGEQCLCTWVFVARGIGGEGWSHTCSLAPLLYTVDWTTAAFACLPSLQNAKYFYRKYLDLFN